MVAAGLDHGLERLRVRTRHHHDVGGPGARDHLRFQVAAVHRLEVGHDRMAWEGGAQLPHRAQALREQERRARLQPVHARLHGHARRVHGVAEVGQIERDLDHARVHGGAYSATG